MLPNPGRPKLPYVVLDQGVLRDQPRVGDLLDRAKAFGELLLLPDIALYEMMQNDQWKETVLSSLRPLSRFPAAVVLAQGPGALLRQELASGEPRLDLVDHEGTHWLRGLLADVQLGSNRMIDEMAARIPPARERHRQQVADHAKNKERLLAMMKAWKTLLGPDLSSFIRLQRDPTRESFRLLLANPKFHAIVIRDLLLREGFSALVASGPSVTAWQFFCFAGLALKWLARGWDDRTEAHASDDLADLDYILLALFCSGGLASRDQVAVELFEDLAAALDETERARVEARESGGRRRLLKQRARECARTLADRYGATRVVLFGSVAREEPRMPGDVDLYVEGLRPQDWVDACVTAESIMGDVRVDLVSAESAQPMIRKTVEAEGETLYEATHG